MTRRSRKAKKLLFEDLERDHARQSQDTDYQPLVSVWFGEDAELLEKKLDFYPRRPPERILDAMVNAGRSWIGSN